MKFYHKLNKSIVLIGMPGCGKSTIGRILANRLDADYIDMDYFIEQSQKKTITEIFKKGEEHFRAVENEAVRAVCGKKSPFIIATGGGTVKNYSNIALLKEKGIIIFINRSVDNIYKDINTDIRPLLKDNKAHLYKLYDERSELYKKYCDFEVANDGELENTVEEILKVVGYENTGN